MLIKEQIRKYKIKMDEINQLEAAESIAFRRLSLLRQNMVSVETNHQATPSGRKHHTSFLGRDMLVVLSIPFSKSKINCKKKMDLDLPKAVGRS